MKKTFRKTITVFLVVFLLTALCLPAMAAKDDDALVYLCLGDSIAAGCALAKDGTEYDRSKIWDSYLGYDFSVAPKAYHSLVKNAIEEKTGKEVELINGARSAMRATEMRSLLGGGYHDFDEKHQWYDRWSIDYHDGNGWKCPNEGEFSEENLRAGFENEEADEHFNYEEAIRKADIISINFGTNDVFSSALLTAIFANIEMLTGLTADANKDTEVVKDNRNSGILSTIDEIYKAYGVALNVVDLLKIVIQNLNLALATYKDNYTWVINKIHELNPDAKIILIGVYNPLRYGTISEDVTLDISAAIDITVAEMNSFIYSFAFNRNYCYYADIADTVTHTWFLADATGYVTKPEGAGTEDFLTFMMNVHPTLAGHEYIAEQILSVLPGELGGNSTSKIADIIRTSLVAKILNSILDSIKSILSQIVSVITTIPVIVPQIH